MKTAKQLERYFKGASNHRRVEILSAINTHEGISVDRLATLLKCNMKTVSEHTRRLVQAGLVNKQYQGREVAHSLSPYGKKFIAFMKTF